MSVPPHDPPVQAALNKVIDSGEYQEVLTRWNLQDEAVEGAELNPPGLPDKTRYGARGHSSNWLSSNWLSSYWISLCWIRSGWPRSRYSLGRAIRPFGPAAA